MSQPFDNTVLASKHIKPSAVSKISKARKEQNPSVKDVIVVEERLNSDLDPAEEYNSDDPDTTQDLSADETELVETYDDTLLDTISKLNESKLPTPDPEVQPKENAGNQSKEKRKTGRSKRSESKSSNATTETTDTDDSMSRTMKRGFFAARGRPSFFASKKTKNNPERNFKDTSEDLIKAYPDVDLDANETKVVHEPNTIKKNKKSMHVDRRFDDEPYSSTLPRSDSFKARTRLSKKSKSSTKSRKKNAKTGRKYVDLDEQYVNPHADFGDKPVNASISFFPMPSFRMIAQSSRSVAQFFSRPVAEGTVKHGRAAKKAKAGGTLPSSERPERGFGSSSPAEQKANTMVAENSKFEAVKIQDPFPHNDNKVVLPMIIQQHSLPFPDHAEEMEGFNHMKQAQQVSKIGIAGGQSKEESKGRKHKSIKRPTSGHEVVNLAGIHPAPYSAQLRNSTGRPAEKKKFFTAFKFWGNTSKSEVSSNKKETGAPDVESSSPPPSLAKEKKVKLDLESDDAEEHSEEDSKQEKPKRIGCFGGCCLKICCLAFAIIVVFLGLLFTNGVWFGLDDPLFNNRIRKNDGGSTESPTTSSQTLSPSFFPVPLPTTGVPTPSPTFLTLQPTVEGTNENPPSPTTQSPTVQATISTPAPTPQPTRLTSSSPTIFPTPVPTLNPTPLPTPQPTALSTTKSPTLSPTVGVIVSELSCAKIRTDPNVTAGTNAGANFLDYVVDGKNVCGDTYAGLDTQRPTRSFWEAFSTRTNCIVLGYSEGLAVCKKVGARLCTLSELKNGAALKTGCNADKLLLYSSTPCTSGGLQGYSRYSSKDVVEECQTDYENVKQVLRCCGDNK